MCINLKFCTLNGLSVHVPFLTISQCAPVDDFTIISEEATATFCGCAADSCTRCNKLHRFALLYPNQSPWQCLYTHGDSSSFLAMTGLSRSAFQQLSLALFVDNNQQPILQRGRPELLDCISQLGLYLFFIGSTMGIKHLCLIFVVVLSVCSKVINRVLRWVVRKLKDDPLAKVRFPDADEKVMFAQMIEAREPTVDDVIGFLDGLSLASECSSEVIEQNSCTMVTIVIQW
jgi:hypothetical protein